MICAKCGNKVAENAVFCGTCGKKIERMQCPHCEEWVDKDAIFCTECGKRIVQRCCPNCGNVLTEDSNFCIFCGVEVEQDDIDEVVENVEINAPIAGTNPPTLTEQNGSDYTKEEKKKSGGCLRIVIGVVVLSIVGCGGFMLKKEEEGEKAPAVEDFVYEEPYQEEQDEIETSYAAQEYKNEDPSVQILDAYISKYAGEPILIVSYEWTNTKSTMRTARTSIGIDAYQNGIQLEKPSFSNEDDELLSRKIKPDTSIRLEEAFYLDDTVSDVQVEVHPWLTFTDEVYAVKTFLYKFYI